jgi:MFS family permease
VMPYLGSIGITRASASLVAGAIPLVSILGRLSSGWIGDRIDKRKVAAAGMFFISLGMLTIGYFYTVSIWEMVMFVIFFSVGWGAMVPMHLALLREYVGRKNTGTILGISLGISSIGSLSGPPLAGWIFDNVGSYQNCWFAYIAAALAGVVCLLTMPSLKKTYMS